jgi:alkanesulfonate monooxygenase SsuD/methylene tetrahydromethanopterin reductase-like flavin-dependent oxidoreductase (luciferase family)
MEFSAMILNMFFPDYDDPADDARIIDLGVSQSLWLAGLGYHPWATDHHFRGPWHSNPMQFAAFLAPQLPPSTYIGFGVLSIPLYHPLRLVESMNLLDHQMKGRVLFGLGSGWQGTEPEALGVDFEYHASGRAAEETLQVMERLWSFKDGDPEYHFAVGTNRSKIKRRVMPASYTKRHPIIMRAASRESALIGAAQKGWPTFLGIFNANLRDQTRKYMKALAEANHPQDVVDDCLRWCTRDWISVVVAKTDDEAKALEKEAQAEQMAIRGRFAKKYGRLDGPVLRPKPGQSTAEAYLAGGDMHETVAGSPETIARQVQELAELGINHLLLRFIGEWAGATRHICENSAKLFAQEVMPLFKSRAPLRDPRQALEKITAA